MLGTKYLSELVKPEMLQAGKLNIIKSPTGSGKSYFALTAIPQTLTDATHRLVYLIDTINGKEQILNNYHAQRDYMDWVNETSHHFLYFDKDCEPVGESVVVITYAKFGKILEEHPNFHEYFDYIICDDRDHASIVDGRRLSFSQQLKYKHNDMADLEKQLQKCNPDSVKLIIVDGVFSMEGDLANLPEIVRLKHKYNATIMVDEAHGLGVFGKQGRGVCDHFGLTHEIDLIMGTFSKSLASIGGFIAADSSIINWLRHNARTYIFSASNTPAATASALEALHIIQNEPERLEALWEATNYALKRFREAGFEIGATESPIIPLYVRDTDKTFMVTKLAFDEGVFINPVIPPACAPQDTLVRVALMATHTKEQIDRAVEKLVKAFKALDIL